MLKALALRYDIGKNTNHRDLLGVLSSHPYSLCAVLRVFGRGIESLPSRPFTDSQVQPPRDVHSPLPPQECAPLMQASPVDYIRHATLDSTGMTAHTGFFVDHTVPGQALRTITYGVNRQLREPWQWPFGQHLAEGHEYLCVLEYQYDAAYNMRPKLDKRVAVQNAPKEDGYSAASSSSQDAINYVQLNEYLVLEKSGGKKTPHSACATGRTGYQELEDCVRKAHCTLDTSDRLVCDTMNGKRVPFDARPFYIGTATTSIGSMTLTLPSCVLTWLELREWVREVCQNDTEALARVRVSQAVHFNEVSEEAAQTLRDSMDAGRVPRM